MSPSKTLRLLAAMLVVTALAVVLASPAHAYWENDSSAPQAPAPVAAPGSGDGTAYGTILAVAGGTVVVLLLGAGAFLVATRHRRVALS